MRRPLLLALALVHLGALPFPRSGVERSVATHDSALVASAAEDGVATVTAAVDGTAVTFRSSLPAPLSLERRGQELVLSRPAVDEVWVARVGQLEQQWRFATRPSTATLELRVQTNQPLRRDALGVQVGPLRYGAATWVDAAGRRTEVAQTIDHQAIVMRVPKAVLDGTTWPATLDPVVSAEVSWPEVGVSRTLGWQGDIAVVADGANFLMVYADERRGVGQARIYSRRVTNEGAPIDTLARIVAPNGVNQLEPNLANGGGVSLAVWVDEGVGSGDIFAVRIDSAGTVLDSPPLVVASAPTREWSPVVSYDGTQFLVAWLDDLSLARTDVKARRISPTGAFVDASARVITSNQSSKSDLAGGGGSFGHVLAWADNRSGAHTEVFVSVVTPTGTSTVNDGTALESADTFDSSHTMVSINGTKALVAWTDRGVTSRTMACVRFDAQTATPLDANPLSVLPVGDTGQRPAAKPEGTGWWVGGVNDSPADRRFFLLPETGPIGTTPVARLFTPYGLERHFALDGFGGDVAYFSSGSDTMLMYTETRAGLYAHTFELDSSSNAHLQTRVTATADGGYLAASLVGVQRTLSDPGYGHVEVWPLAADGRAAGPSFRLEQDVVFPAIASNASGGAVVFSHYFGNAVALQRIGPDGSPLNGATTLGVGEDPSVAVNGNELLVVWNGGGNEPLLFARVRAGVVIDPGGAIVNGGPVSTGFYLRHSDVAFDGASYLVMWIELNSSGQRHVRAAHVTSSGTVTEPAGLSLAPLSQQFSGAVAAGPQGALVVWEDTRSGTLDVYAARFGADGGPLLDVDGGFALTTAAGDQYAPTVTWDGSRFVVAWLNETVTGDIIEGVTVRPDGTVEPGFILTATPGASFPRLASSGNGQSLLAFGRYEFAPPVDALRTHFVTVGIPLALGGVCSADADCASGHCVDGVCCDGVCGGGVRDCQVCSSALGASVNGTCTPLGAGTTCRPPVSVCDLPEVCGSTALCPPDDVLGDGTQCGTGVCMAGFCSTGMSGPDAGTGTDGGVLPAREGPSFTSTPPALASCNQAWLYRPEVTSSSPVSFRVRGVGGAVPDRLYVNSDTGEVLFRPEKTQTGPVSFELVAANGSGVSVQRVDLTVECPGLTVGCSCDSGTGSVLMVVALAAMRRRRARVSARGNRG